MVTALEEMGIVPMQFKLDGNRPDLQKLDSLLGLLATESSFFVSQIQSIAEEVEKNGLKTVLENGASALKVPVEEMRSISLTATTTSTSSAAPTPSEAEKGVLTEVDKFVREEKEASERRASKGKEKAGEPEKGVCVVCEDNRANICLLECGHLCLCKSCSPDVVLKNSCPLCRSPIARSVKIYHPV